MWVFVLLLVLIDEISMLRLFRVFSRFLLFFLLTLFSSTSKPSRFELLHRDDPTAPWRYQHVCFRCAVAFRDCFMCALSKKLTRGIEIWATIDSQGLSLRFHQLPQSCNFARWSVVVSLFSLSSRFLFFWFVASHAHVHFRLFGSNQLTGAIPPLPTTIQYL